MRRVVHKPPAPPAPQVHYNDPSEELEVFDHRGRPTGRARSRMEIHRDGDWHLAFHCWVLRQGVDGREIVMQRRSLDKDTFGGLWDATAAGHWRYGESAEDAAREIEEELGLVVPFSRLIFNGRERISRRFPSGLIDREHHQVYVLESDTPLQAYRPNPAEVSAIAAWRSRDLLAVLSGRVPQISAVEAFQVSPQGTLQSITANAQRPDFVPYSAARIHRLLQK